jgi:hypothetical protein
MLGNIPRLHGVVLHRKNLIFTLIGAKTDGTEVTAHSYLVKRLICGASPPLPLNAFMEIALIHKRRLQRNRLSVKEPPRAEPQ